MIVTLDGQRVTPDFDENQTLQALLDGLRETTAADRLIVAVSLDGHLLDEDDLNAAMPRPLTGNKQVDLESGDRLELCRDVLRGLAAEFGKSRGHFEPIADTLADGNTALAMHHVGEFIGLWQTCYRGLAECGSLLGQDITQYECEGRTLQAALESLVDQLTALRGALEARDLVLLADMVRYELPPLAEDWQTLLIGVADQLKLPTNPQSAAV